MCLSTKILYQYLFVFYPAWDNSSSENILKCHCIAQSEERETEGD